MASRNILGFSDLAPYSVDAPAPVDYSMSRGVLGAYGGLKLVPPGGSTWRRYPSQNPLLKNPIFVPQHGGGPLANEVVPVNIPDDSMFMFAKNISSPYCCPSTYSSDMGCVCTNKQQRDMISSRGNRYQTSENPQF